MKIKQIHTLTILVLATLWSSCSDFLDKVPDNRAELVTSKQISKFLSSGYSDGNYAVMCELSSDNFIDNNSPDKNGIYYNLSSFDRMHDEIFAFEAAVSSDEQDSPSAVWSGCYKAIAVANHALKAIETIEAQGKGNEVKAQKGEALLIRAYNHFILVNIFAKTYKNDLLSAQDKGIPYVTEPETKVLVNYERESVSDVYNLIEKDLIEGLVLVDDVLYDVPKYHFNKRAANAFAARFFLFKRKYADVVKYASAALGEIPSKKMRNWNANYPTYDAFVYGWINASNENNFLLVQTQSWVNRIFGTRYGCNREAATATIFGSGPTWTGFSYHPCYNGKLYLRGAQDYGLFFPKSGELFEYTDKVARIGFAHIVRAEFTGDETILCRAEALVYLNRTTEAIADLKTFDDARHMNGVSMPSLTETLIRNFYTPGRTPYVNTFNTENISPDFVVSTNQKALIDCILHYRRIETVFDGLRWFDLKRYGIEITHHVGKSREEILTWNDERRALQIPQEVIAAGMEANTRLTDGSAPNNTLLKLSPTIENIEK
ncbi:MAG: hypothetical protein AUK44_04855 [Porphyromonadaceae bacterium CG2_30_38_12]|nr:MAG: hypothetical protein AUK44_04855 [Porphyromonadaceae bacterium CG2_30_38_12]